MCSWERACCMYLRCAVCPIVGIPHRTLSEKVCGMLAPLSASQVSRAVPPRGCGAVPVRCSRTGWGRPGAGYVDSRGTGVHALLARRCRVARASLCRGGTQCGAGRCHGLLTHRCKRPPLLWKTVAHCPCYTAPGLCAHALGYPFFHGCAVCSLQQDFQQNHSSTNRCVCLNTHFTHCRLTSTDQLTALTSTLGGWRRAVR